MMVGGQMDKDYVRYDDKTMWVWLLLLYIVADTSTLVTRWLVPGHRPIISYLIIINQSSNINLEQNIPMNRGYNTQYQNQAPVTIIFYLLQVYRLPNINININASAERYGSSICIMITTNYLWMPQVRLKQLISICLGNAWKYRWQGDLLE